MHNLREVDHREKIPPGKIGEHVDLLFMLQTVRQCGHSCDGLSRWPSVVLNLSTLRVLREIALTVVEETGHISWFVSGQYGDLTCSPASRP